MSKIYEKSKFVEYLRETPLVSFACKKIGISRATYYRWYKDDRGFRESIQKVLQQGRANINDLAEATLIKMIKSENFNATRFWLQHNNKRYVPIRTTYVEPLEHSHIQLKPGETCTYCGTNKPPKGRSGAGFYESNFEEGTTEVKLEEKKTKKRKKLSGEEKRNFIREAKLKEEGIEVYERLARVFPEYEGGAEKIRNGTMKYYPVQNKAGVRIDKKKKKERESDDSIDDVIE